MLLVSCVIRGGFGAMGFLRLLFFLAMLTSSSAIFAQAVTHAITSSIEPSNNAIRLAANPQAARQSAEHASAEKTRYGARERVAPTSLCKLSPPENYPEIEPVEYICHDIEERINAQAMIDSKVTHMFIQRGKAAEAERKRKAAARKRPQAVQKNQQPELERKQAEAARLADESLRQQQQALAASAAVQEKLSMDITRKMIAVCKKSWAQGKHRCYCEKYIEFAPANIKSNPGCK
ncbi:MAG: hypothetical protein WBP02_12995 [Gammaproteobacteria bacterium]